MSVDWARIDEHDWQWDSGQGMFGVHCIRCGAEMFTDFDYDEDVPAPAMECVAIDTVSAVKAVVRRQGTAAGSS